MTLIEVLIAAIILFMAIGLVSSAFQQSLLLQRKVMGQLDKVELIEISKPMIKFDLNQGKSRGNLDILSEKIEWQAEVIERKPFAASLNEENESISGFGYMTLFNVVLKQGDEELLSFKYTIWNMS